MLQPIRWLLLGASVFCTAGISNAGIIFLDNFDSNSGQGNISSGAVDSSATGTFNVTGGNVDVVGPGFFAGLCATTPETGSCIDLDGTTNGTITSTSISLLAGHSYTLAFDIFGTERGGDTTATVTFNSLYSHTFVMHSADQNIVSVNFVAPANASASIVFQSNDAAGATQGALIDNVSVTDNNVAAPEPGSAALLLFGMPLAWGLRRLRSRG